jgi:hypothetical protein
VLNTLQMSWFSATLGVGPVDRGCHPRLPVDADRGMKAE